MKPVGVPHSPPSPRSTPPRATHLSIHPPPPTAPLPDPSASPRRSSPNSHQSASLVVTSPLPRDTPIPSRPTPAALDEPELSSELSELSDSGASDDGVVDDQPPSGTEGASTTVSRPRPVNRGGAKPSVWKDHVAAAFDRGLKLIPDIDKQHVLLNGRRVQRNDLLCEYVRRQTGERRTHQQARNRISTVRARYPHDHNLERLLVGRPVSQGAIDTMDWDALLGPDQFPQVAPVLSDLDSTKAPGKKRRRASATTTSSKRRKAVPASTPADGRRAKGPSTSGSTPSHKQLFDPFASSGPPPPSRRPPPPPPPAPWVEPLPVRPLPPPSAALPSRPLPDTTYHPFVANLARVFSSYEPARDHTTTARVLVGLGVDSWDALADLCAFEPSTVERLYEHLRKEVGLGALEVAWVKKAPVQQGSEALETALPASQACAHLAPGVPGLVQRADDDATRRPTEPLGQHARSSFFPLRSTSTPTSQPSCTHKPSATVETVDEKSDLDSDEDNGEGAPIKERLWDAELDAVLFKGMRLLPKMRTRTVHLESDGQSMGRNGLLAEYVRRQTGKYRSRRQVTSHLVSLRLAIVGKQRLNDLPLFVGHDLSAAAFAAVNWSDLLGADLFPETARAALIANDKVKLEWNAAVSARRKRRMGLSALESARSSRPEKSRPRTASSRFVDSSSSDEHVVELDGLEPHFESEPVEPAQAGTSARSRKRLRSASSSSGEADAVGERVPQEDAQKASSEGTGRWAGSSPSSKRARGMLDLLAASSPARASAPNPSPAPSFTSTLPLSITHPPTVPLPGPFADLTLATSSSSRISPSFTTVSPSHCDLSAFLAGLHSTLVALAPSLDAAGFNTVDALAKLVLLEPSTIALVLESVRRRASSPVSVIHLRLLGRQLDDAGRALRRAAR